MKPAFKVTAFLFIFLYTFSSLVKSQTIVGSRMNEVFKETTLHGVEDATLGFPYPAGNMYNPWEITYGPDSFLWITEARGYRIRRMNPATGAVSTVLFLSNGASGFLTPTEHTAYNCGFDSTFATWPQGGMMGMAVHPDFMHATAPKKFVYVGYVYKYDSVSATANGGHFFKTKLVRFTYNTSTLKLESPVSLCDSIKGSNDHNSGRMIIAPVGGVNYLFYSVGDLGSGNYLNKQRVNRSQNSAFYEGKILRFNLEPDGNAGTYDRWIPDSTGVHNNPFNGVKQSAVYTTGVRNNQGFAYNPITNKLYGAEHGQFSDDEINIVEAGKNYGHPLVQGYNDGNYNNAKAGSSSGTMPLITSESTNASNIGPTFRGPLYTFFPAPNGPNTTNNTILKIYQSTTGDPGGNSTWHSVAHSGMDIYTSSFIPGWQNSLLTAAMKKAKFFRMKLNNAGDTVVATPAGSTSPANDTVGIFFAQNRYRDLAISKDGKTIFAAIDKDASTSGPTVASPQGSLCPGCIKKFEFLGYNDNSGVSTLPASIAIGPGVGNTVTRATNTVINADNNNLWVPVTDSLGNIVAEIDANGNNLGNITASFYKNSGAIRTTSAGKPYLDRSITINVQNQPTTAVNVRLYITAAELAALVGAPGSAVATINEVYIFKNSDVNGTAITNSASTIVPTAWASFSTNYVIKASISSFSTFYFGGLSVTLPLNQITLSGKYLYQSNLLQWKTDVEKNTTHYIIERSNTGQNFKYLATVAAAGSGTPKSYIYNDFDDVHLQPNELYYRLKIIHADGTFTYSNTISISPLYVTGRITIFPNPALSEMKATVVSPADVKASWRIIDKTGRIVLQNTAWMKKGSNELILNVNKLSSGTYYLKISGTGIAGEAKFQKL